MWLPVLKAALNSNNSQWEIFRGDSFQLESSVNDALIKAIYIKTCVKTIKGIDVRIAIGIGNKTYSAEKVSESNGEAFIFSGKKLEMLKKERLTLVIQSKWPDFDYELNIAVRLALIAMNSWAPITAEVVKLAIEHPYNLQQDLSEVSKRSNPLLVKP